MFAILVGFVILILLFGLRGARALIAGALIVLVPGAVWGWVWLLDGDDRFRANLAAHGQDYALAAASADRSQFAYAALGVVGLSIVIGLLAAGRSRRGR